MFYNIEPQATFLLTGRLGSSASLASVFVSSAEVYPTSIRVSAIGIFSLFGCAFSVVAVFVDFYLPGAFNFRGVSFREKASPAWLDWGGGR